jgi:hypothetical protein
MRYCSVTFACCSYDVHYHQFHCQRRETLSQARVVLKSLTAQHGQQLHVVTRRMCPSRPTTLLFNDRSLESARREYMDTNKCQVVTGMKLGIFCNTLGNDTDDDPSQRNIKFKVAITGFRKLNIITVLQLYLCTQNDDSNPQGS